MKRREFIRNSALSVGAALGAGLARNARAQEPITKQAGEKGMIWANLLHLGFNMWVDWDTDEGRENYTNMSDTLRFDEPLWKDITGAMVAAGMNMVVIDLGEGVKYESHPELAVKGSWPVDKLKQELVRLRGIGLEPIPKLNFSATHDAWLGPYSRAVSTDAYYAVVRDLIAEVCAMFDTPRFFHLGMDEETYGHQKRYEYVVVRQHDLWWRDFLHLVENVEKAGVRPWIWSDYIWEHKDVFVKRMPKSVVQSNWYYDDKFSTDVNYVKAYHDLADAGYDQIPTGSNWSTPTNFGKTVEYCRQHIPAEHLLGFLQTPWKPTLPECRQRHMEAIEQVGKARASIT